MSEILSSFLKHNKLLFTEGITIIIIIYIFTLQSFPAPKHCLRLFKEKSFFFIKITILTKKVCPDSRQASPTATCDLFIMPGKKLALFTVVLVVCIVTGSQATGEIKCMYASYKFLMNVS